jgi:hypothetical protein
MIFRCFPFRSVSDRQQGDRERRLRVAKSYAPRAHANKNFARLLESAPSAQEFCQRGGSQSVGRDRGEQNEDRLALSDVEVLRLVPRRKASTSSSLDPSRISAVRFPRWVSSLRSSREWCRRWC